MKRLRIVATLGLLAGFSLACADFQEGFQQGTNQALEQSFSETQGKLEALPHSPARKRALHVCELGKVAAAEGRIELVDGSVFVGELEAMISDGDITDEEADTIVQKYQALTGETVGM